MSVTPQLGEIVISEESRARIGKMVEALKGMSQSTNGESVYSADKTMIGHLEAPKYLLIPSDVALMCESAPPMDIDVRRFGSIDGPDNLVSDGKEEYKASTNYLNFTSDNMTDEQISFVFTKVSLMNFASLTNSGMNVVNSLAASLYRARWVLIGAFTALLADNTNTTIEHVIVDESHVEYGVLVSATDEFELYSANTELFEQYYNALDENIELLDFVVMTAEHIFSFVEHVFRTKGHHYKSNDSDVMLYKRAYMKLFQASFEGTVSWPESVDMDAIFHTAIHPFRIRTLVVITAHSLLWDKISPAMYVRLTSSSCGHAIVTTTRATLNVMKGEAWWTSFNDAFSDSIAMIDELANQLDDNKYGFHQAANLYGVVRASTVKINEVTMRINTAKSKIAYIAAASSGMVQAMHELVKDGYISGFALSNARCLEKAAMDAPMLAATVKILVLTAASMLADKTNIEDLVAAALPDIRKKYVKAISS